MEERSRNRLRELIPAQEAVLRDVASGRRSAVDAEADYKRLHSELRQILTADGRGCMCPWGSIQQWAWTAAGNPGWEAVLDGLVDPYKVLAGDTAKVPWALIDYRRNGDPDDVPFEIFEAGLEPHKQAILVESLTRELAFRGPAVIDDPTKGHKMDCDTRARPKKTVFMYKIRQGHAAGEVVLRVFFMTAPGYRLVVLHGYDKGADPDAARELAETAEACARRTDVVRQLGEDRRR